MQIRLKEWVLPSIVGVLSFGTGFGVGYFLSTRRFVNHVKGIEERIDEVESDQMTFDFKTSTEMQKYLSQMDILIKKLKEGTQQFLAPITQADVDEHPSGSRSNSRWERLPIAQEPEEDRPVITTIFDGEVDDWNYEEEERNRGPDHPYVIHRDEFFGHEAEGYSQTTLTWYDGDKILTDEDETPVHAPERVVGRLEFGRGSQDPNVVYIRNDRLQAEYEVLRDDGYYQVEILGALVEGELTQDDLKHSILKFRPE